MTLIKENEAVQMVKNGNGLEKSQKKNQESGIPFYIDIKSDFNKFANDFI